ncbi:SigE family RNA polymerase sigma factor [Actinopolymorpha singaporensis]|uniref:RNA polymerase sigma-70 factor, sigma-E family n=1 Tax=Actinopolymorpha singaporensis TaxID=117157 RepID=A0A1H1R1I2_9ACTN|nr:SigE family RNA polymerase sigma factor [Actinopolymorpha singaporensis]SDS29553.1 RNA polymerase sigma-70 factor, sigma-E family [Actinopolymorpha singaporensis]
MSALGVIESGVVGAVEAEARRSAKDVKDAEFEAYMAARQSSLLRTAYLLTGERHSAEDLVQTALAKLYLSWDKVRRREHLDGYVRKILVNENNSLWRLAWRRKEFTTGEVPEHGSVTDQHDHGERSALWEFVQTLPRRQRAVIVLRYYEDLSEAEIAEILGISVGTVKSQASRALAAMRQRVHTQPMLAKDREEER